jgi:hypothetical protein
MNSLQEEIKRNKKLMGLAEGLNLPKINHNEVLFAEKYINRLVIKIKDPDPHDKNYVGFYDKKNQLVMDYCKTGENKGKFSISSEQIYDPIQGFANTKTYDETIPIIRKALQKIFPHDIDYISNVSHIESFWNRKDY